MKGKLWHAFLLFAVAAFLGAMGSALTASSSGSTLSWVLAGIQAFFTVGFVVAAVVHYTRRKQT